MNLTSKPTSNTSSNINSNANSNSSNTITRPETSIDLALLVTNTEKMIYEATSRENVEQAQNYYESNEIKGKIKFNNVSFKYKDE